MLSKYYSPDLPLYTASGSTFFLPGLIVDFFLIIWVNTVINRAFTFYTTNSLVGLGPSRRALKKKDRKRKKEKKKYLQTIGLYWERKKERKKEKKRKKEYLKTVGGHRERKKERKKERKILRTEKHKFPS